MKSICALLLATFLAGSVQAQVEILPPDFVLFGMTSGDYCAEYHQQTLPASTNEDYLFPNASPFSNERVYFLHRPTAYLTNVGLQTYFVPDDVYVYLPILVYNWDNVNVDPPLTPEQLCDILSATLDRLTVVRLNIDGVPLANPFDYRTKSPFFSVYFPTPDNIYSFLLGQPFEGLVDPEISGGYLVMLKPLPPGLHDVHTAYTFAYPELARERHYQVISLPVPQFLAHKSDQLAASVTASSLAANRQQPLLANLHRAEASFDSNNLRAGTNHLRAFQQIVQAQVARQDPLLAEQLTAAAQKIMDQANARLK